MASRSTMVAVNVPDSRDNSLTPPPPEKSLTRKGAPRKTCQGATKNLAPTLLPPNKQTADQAFHDASSKMVPDSQLQNEVANLEPQVLEAKKAALQKQFQTLTTANPALPTERPAENSREVRNSNFVLFYEHQGEESHLVALMRKYWLVDIQYI